MTSGYFGGSTGGGNASWSISRGNEAPKQARPQRNQAAAALNAPITKD
jgi:hypothetical protein